MIDGRRDNPPAARIALRRVAILLICGTASVFVANLLTGWLLLLVAPVVATLWLWAVSEGVVDTWRVRHAGAIAVIPVAIAGFGLFAAWTLAWQALYWSHVAPSAWLLWREHSVFGTALKSHIRPNGVYAIEGSGGRTAFHTVNGMLGTWSGIVHDPSGRLSLARGWGGKPVPADIRYLFGSETRWCQRLDGAWFHCHFD